ncbi:response regulator transcription factor [bacterium]|nr:response regulator transcription factor [bacterium]
MKTDQKGHIPKGRIKVLLADHQSLCRIGLSNYIATTPEIEVIGDVGTGREAIELCEKLQPDVLLLELDLPDIDGFDVVRQLLISKSSVKTLVLTAYDNEEYAIRLIKSGATGYINREITFDELIEAIKIVSSGSLYLSQSLRERITSRLLQPVGSFSVADLSNRELQIISRLGLGETIKTISSNLFLSQRTVETYKSRAMKKLGLKNIGELVRFTIRNNLISKY